MNPNIQMYAEAIMDSTEDYLEGGISTEEFKKEQAALWKHVQEEEIAQEVADWLTKAYLDQF